MGGAPREAPRPLPAVLQGAEMITVEVNGASPARGKLLRELQLRSTTGASAVGIERAAGPIVNPGPDEELREGDCVLLLGRRPHQETAVLLVRLE